MQLVVNNIFNTGICLIEWGEIIEDALPPTYINITFERDFEHDSKRILKISSVGNKYVELVKKLF